MQDERARLLAILKTFAFQRGSFVLASGRRSCYYLDARRASLHPEGAYLIGRLIFDRLESEIENGDVNAVGGLTLGADPIATAVALTSYEQGKPIMAFIVRKERKEHGTQRVIEGPFPEDASVVIVEDSVTTGSSPLQAARAVEQEGGKVVKVIAIVDRLEGAREAITAAGYAFESLFTTEDFGVTQEELEAFARANP